MNTPYHKIDSKILEFDLESVEFKFGMWITKKEFGQRLNQNKPLPKGQFFMSVRVVAKDIEITEKIARRLIKQFTKLDIIRLVSSSKNPKQGSIYEYLVQIEEDTVKDTVKAQLGHSKNEKISVFEYEEGHINGTIEDTIEGTSKKKNKRKENIYSDLIKKYPGRKVKSVRDSKLPKILKEYSIEEIERCINRYAEECKGKEKRFILNESTFWNGRYVDYLDENFEGVIVSKEEKAIDKKLLDMY